MEQGLQYWLPERTSRFIQRTLNPKSLSDFSIPNVGDEDIIYAEEVNLALGAIHWFRNRKSPKEETTTLPALPTSSQNPTNSTAIPQQLPLPLTTKYNIIASQCSCLHLIISPDTCLHLTIYKGEGPLVLDTNASIKHQGLVQGCPQVKETASEGERPSPPDINVSKAKVEKTVNEGVLLPLLDVKFSKVETFVSSMKDVLERSEQDDTDNQNMAGNPLILWHLLALQLGKLLKEKPQESGDLVQDGRVRPVVVRPQILWESARPLNLPSCKFCSPSSFDVFTIPY